jgi:hypothetical protein
MVSPVLIIFQIINAFGSLGHWGCISIIKATKSEYKFKKMPFSYALCSTVYASNIAALLSVSTKMCG